MFDDPLQSGKIETLQGSCLRFVTDEQVQGETEIADDSNQAMNAINTGNTSMLELLKDKTSGLAISEVGILNGLKNASTGTSYLYVFKNKMWNGTWDVMTGRRLSEDIVA